MRLDQYLYNQGLVRSRSHAQDVIKRGLVVVNGTVCTKNSKEITSGEDIALTAAVDVVSRAGEKLEGLLLDLWGDEERIKNSLEGKIAIDVGSSTGGFTECLIRHGVSRVDAVDVGTMQLHPKLRNDPKVHIFENTDIRSFKNNSLYDIVVVDVSFISLSSILPTIVSLGNKGALYCILVKPQFEVGKGNTKKGVVKNEKEVKDILTFYTNESERLGLHSQKIYKTTLPGKAGNQEYFLTAIKS